jgi:Leucine-rich repeat (LRR) protein
MQTSRYWTSINLAIFVTYAALLLSEFQRCGGQCLISEREYDGLEDLYLAADGAHWTWNTSDPASIWSFPSDLDVPCSGWHGIVCSSTRLNECSVISLNLSNFGLVGAIPQHIVYLSVLQNMTLSNNKLGLDIPTEIGNMTTLEYVELAHNLLEYTIPKSLYNLERLVYLDLSYNRITGTLSAHISKLSSLQQFFLVNNFLVSSIPTELYSLTALTNISFDDIFLTGSLSPTLGNLINLRSFSVAANLLSGPIPHEIQNLSQLKSFVVSYNHLNGSIPSELWLIPSLEFLALDLNNLTGALNVPTSVGAAGLTSLHICCNSITGTIPSELGTLTNLSYFGLDSNGPLTGTMPNSLCSLTNLRTLYVSTNYLTGSLLPCFGDFVLLSNADFDSNHFTSSLPAELGNWRNLTTLYAGYNYLSQPLASELFEAVDWINVGLNNNFLSGEVPAELSHLVSLEYIELATNMFSGYFPEVFGRMSAIQTIYLKENQFSGPLPSQFHNTLSVLYIDISNNSLSGSVPSVYTEFVNMEFIFIGFNQLTGNFGNMNWTLCSRLQVLSIEANSLSGPISATVAKSAALRALYLNENVLSSTLPSEIAEPRFLNFLIVAANFIEGALPLSIAHLERLEVLNVSLNFLSGGIAPIFDGNLSKLVIVDMSQNAFSGSLSTSLFTVSNHTTDIVMYENCFKSGLPSAICSATSLATLVLDSMNTAPACQHDFGALKSIFKVVISSIIQDATIPDCVWAMPNLNTLHLSGNGLYGTLGDLLDGVTSLTDVSIASNRLVGSIPMSWQQYGRFVQLDLSSNKLSGALEADFNISAANATVDLSINRLSGDIPGAFMTASNVNILDGNLFQCHADDMPESDPDRNEYVCGSDDFDVSLILWVVLLCVAGLISFVHWKDIKLRSAVVSNQPLLTLLVRAVAWWSCLVSGAYVVIVMLGYVILKLVPHADTLYSTHIHQYTWTTTVAYLHGIAPTAVVATGLLMSVVSLRTVFCPVDSASIVEGSRISGWLKYFRFEHSWIAGQVLVVTVIHMAVTVAGNVAYVYAIINGLKTDTLILLQILMSVFKLVWNRYYVRNFVGYIPMSLTRQLLCQCGMLMFTFLVSPIIATFFLDNTCFRYIILGQPSVSSSFLTDEFSCILECDISPTNAVHCFDVCGVAGEGARIIGYSSAVPSWLYSYQCSSSILTNYIPVLLFAYAISGIVVPVFRWLAWHSCEMRIQKWPKWVRKIILGSQDRIGNHAVHAATAILCKECLNMSVLLTFGLACPLLAVAVCLDCWTVLFGLELSWPLRNDTISLAKDIRSPILLPDSSRTATAGVEKRGTTGVTSLDGSALQQGVLSIRWLIVLVSCMFWSFFLFDMMGDVYGSSVGGWTTGLCLAVVLIAYGISGYCKMPTLLPVDHLEEESRPSTFDTNLNDSFL